MKQLHTMLLLASGLLGSGAAMAATATYQYCSTDGCRAGASQTVSSTYAKTKYPIILAHGMAGFSGIAGVDYFYNIGPDLTKNGARVFETQVASFDSTFHRGEQLLNQTRQILAITGAPQVNFIGHSQGVLDARYVAGIIPEQVASVTSVGGVNQGSPVADAVKKVIDTPGVNIFAGILLQGVDAFFSIVGVGSGHKYDNSTIAGLNQLSVAGMAAFNQSYPAGMPATACGQGPAIDNGIRFYSWGGTGKVTTLIDISDAFMTATGLLVPGESDGLVPRCSSHLGQVIRDNYTQNHFDEVNQVVGLVYAFETSPTVLYRNQANRLQQAGL